MKPKNKKFEKCFKSLIKETMGPGVYNPAGINTVTTDPLSYGKRSQNPPYSSYSAKSGETPGGLGVVTQSDDETQGAKPMPYPLSTSADSLADAYTQLKNVQTQIKEALKNPVLRKIQIQALKDSEIEIQQILSQIKTIGNNILKIRLN